MGHHLIRDDINYGEVDVVELAGIRFVVSTFRLMILKLQPVEVAEIPQFSRDLFLDVLFANNINTVMCHVLDLATVRDLAAALSKHTGLDVRVEGSARILATYRYGQLQGRVHTLDEFYTGLTADEIAKVTF